jgi:hypothetical protein
MIAHRQPEEAQNNQRLIYWLPGCWIVVLCVGDRVEIRLSKEDKLNLHFRTTRCLRTGQKLKDVRGRADQWSRLAVLFLVILWTTRFGALYR